MRTYQLATDQLQLAENWLVKQRTLWERRLNQLDTYLLDLSKETGQ